MRLGACEAVAPAHPGRLAQLRCGQRRSEVASVDCCAPPAPAGIQRVSDFEWVSRLRYYWREDVWVDMVQVGPRPAAAAAGALRT
jgi:hypothetical protein